MSERERDTKQVDDDVAALFGNLTALRVDDSWHDDVLEAAMHDHRQSLRRRQLIGGISGLAIAVTIGALLWRPSRRDGELSLAVMIQHRDGGPTRGDEAMVGDHIVVRARADAESDLRVFRNGTTLLASCPGDSDCTTSNGSEKMLDVAIAVPGEYEVVLAAGAGLAPKSASMDRFLAAARSRDIRVVQRLIDVR